ncbi:MAG: hypothetical protein HRU40_11615 [Saprospiraceae bacterium]|nr:hypothetical protein [Saprospiraceae bacterium]
MIALITALIMSFGINFSSDVSIFTDESRSGETIQIDNNFKAESKIRSDEVRTSGIIYADLTGC